MSEQALDIPPERLGLGGLKRHTSSLKSLCVYCIPLNEEAGLLYAAGGGEWLAHLCRKAPWRNILRLQSSGEGS